MLLAYLSLLHKIDEKLSYQLFFKNSFNFMSNAVFACPEVKNWLCLLTIDENLLFIWKMCKKPQVETGPHHRFWWWTWKKIRKKHSWFWNVSICSRTIVAGGPKGYCVILSQQQKQKKIVPNGWNTFMIYPINPDFSHIKVRLVFARLRT